MIFVGMACASFLLTNNRLLFSFVNKKADMCKYIWRKLQVTPLSRPPFKDELLSKFSVLKGRARITIYRVGEARSTREGCSLHRRGRFARLGPSGLRVARLPAVVAGCGRSADRLYGWGSSVAQRSRPFFSAGVKQLRHTFETSLNKPAVLEPLRDELRRRSTASAK